MKKKNFILVLLFSLFLSAPSFAQEAENRLSPEAEAYCSKLTRSMASKILLNEEEVILLKTLNKEMILKTEEINKAYGNDATTKAKKFKEIDTFFRSKLKPILKPYQLQAFLEMKLTPETWTVTAAKDAGSLKELSN